MHCDMLTEAVGECLRRWKVELQRQQELYLLTLALTSTVTSVSACEANPW